MLFITALAAWGGRNFAEGMPFYVWIPACIAFAYLGSIVLTELIARTPLAVALTGRKQVPWWSPRSADAASASTSASARRSGSHRAGPHPPAKMPAGSISPESPSAAAGRDRESTTLASTACDQNGA